jgi:hypothetical protein
LFKTLRVRELTVELPDEDNGACAEIKRPGHIYGKARGREREETMNVKNK